MRRICFLAFVLFTLAAVAGYAADQPAGKEDPKIRTSLLAGKTLKGKLTEVNVEGEQKTLTLTVMHQAKKANPGEQKKYMDLLQKWRMAQFQKKEGEAKNLEKQLIEVAPKTFDLVETPCEFKLTIPADANLVRRAELPPKESDDGQPAKYTPAELQKLKGSGNQPGYLAALKDLEVDQYVEVAIDKKNLKPLLPGATEAPLYPATKIMILPPPKEMVLPGNPFLGK